MCQKLFYPSHTLNIEAAGRGLTMSALTELEAKQKVLHKAVNFLDSWQAQSKKKSLVNTFFHLLAQGKKTAARKVLERIKQSAETSQWRRGYINALDGMMNALETTNDRDVFINQIRVERCDELGRIFLKQSGNELQADFDKGYFAAWADYMQALKPTTKMEQTILPQT